LPRTPLEKSWVFGSIAADEPAAGSDVDLCIVGSLGLREAVRRLAKLRIPWVER